MPPNHRRPKPALDAPQADECDQSTLVDALMDSRRYPHAVKNVRLTETHISLGAAGGAICVQDKKSGRFRLFGFHQPGLTPLLL